MSRAFAKEYDDQWLGDVEASLPALMVYLTRENGGQRTYEIKTHSDAKGRQIHEMSNGLSYTLDDNNRWQVVLDY